MPIPAVDQSGQLSREEWEYKQWYYFIRFFHSKIVCSSLESPSRSAPFDRSGLCSTEREEERGEAVWHTVVLLGHTACVAHNSACRTQYLCQIVLEAHCASAFRTPQKCMARSTQQHCVAQHNSAWGTQCSCQCGTQCLPPSSNCPLKVTQRMNEHPCLLWQPSSIGGFEEKMRNSLKWFETIFSSSDLPF